MNTAIFQVLFTGVALAHPTLSITAKQPLAQAVLESANFTSHVWDVNNNCFGMMAPNARDTTATNKGKGGYAVYDNPLDCIRDFFLWAEAMGIKNDADLDAFVKAGRYATDKQYYTKVQNQIKSLTAAGKYLNPAVILGTGVLGAAGLTYAGGVAIANMLDNG